MVDRREFLGTAAAMLAVSCMRNSSTAGGAVPSASRASPTGRLPIGFSTLGSPRWDWVPTLDFAAAHGYAAVELRGLRDVIELPQAPEFQRARIPQTLRELREHGLVISDLGASANLHDLDPVKHEAQLGEARSFIDLAALLGVPYVRVFGNKYLAGVSREQTLGQIASALRSLGHYARARNVVVLLESHGDFTDSPTLVDLMQRADSPAVAILWDAHHTFAFGKESPETTVAAIGPYIRHTHLKDSVPANGDRRYVLTGTGDVPIRRQIEALSRIGYPGFYNFEWEKRWHPEIEEPEVAFAQFATVVSGYLRDAGVRPLVSS